MTYTVTDDFRGGMPASPKNTLPYRLIACHDTEGGTGIVGARGTISYLQSVASSRNASYHELWAYEQAADVFTVIRIVRMRSCSHSLNPQPPAKGGSYEPDAWVRYALGAGLSDPNQGVYAVSIAGKVADVNRYAADPRFVAHARKRITELRRELPSLAGMAEHFRFNPSTRTDWGIHLTQQLGGLDFSTPIEDDMIIRTPTVTEQWNTNPGAAFTRADGSSGTFVTSEKVLSHAELTLTDGSDARLLDYGPRHEALVIKREGLRPISGTRVAGLPGYTEAQLQAAIRVAKAETKDKAIAAVEAL